MVSSESSPKTKSFSACVPEATADALKQAEKLVTKRGQRFTRIRRKVLELLLDAEEPAKAYDLLDKLDGEGSAKPPTIYRALEFLLEAGLAHKIESLNAYVACGHFSHQHSAIFMICDSCGGATELHSAETHTAITSEANASGFQTDRVVVETHGTCRDCVTA